MSQNSNTHQFQTSQNKEEDIMELQFETSVPPTFINSEQTQAFPNFQNNTLLYDDTHGFFGTTNTSTSRQSLMENSYLLSAFPEPSLCNSSFTSSLNFSSTDRQMAPGSSVFSSKRKIPQEELRAERNAVEKQRREYIATLFTQLATALPNLRDSKASRPTTLEKTLEFIQTTAQREPRFHYEIEKKEQELLKKDQELAKKDQEIEKKEQTIRNLASQLVWLQQNTSHYCCHSYLTTTTTTLVSDDTKKRTTHDKQQRDAHYVVVANGYQNMTVDKQTEKPPHEQCQIDGASFLSVPYTTTEDDYSFHH